MTALSGFLDSKEWQKDINMKSEDAEKLMDDTKGDGTKEQNLEKYFDQTKRSKRREHSNATRISQNPRLSINTLSKKKKFKYVFIWPEVFQIISS